ncbi:MAG: hypothetical protein ACFCUN_03825 [Hyphomicrobiaceae bacterium]
MGLMKPPGLITFLVTVAIALTALVAQVGLAFAPLTPIAFWILLGAFVLLALGAVTRGL